MMRILHHHASTAMPSVLAMAARAHAVAGVLLLTVGLASGLLVLLIEHQAPHDICDLLWLGALLEDA